MIQNWIVLSDMTMCLFLRVVSRLVSLSSLREVVYHDCIRFFGISSFLQLNDRGRISEMVTYFDNKSNLNLVTCRHYRFADTYIKFLLRKLPTNQK